MYSQLSITRIALPTPEPLFRFCNRKRQFFSSLGQEMWHKTTRNSGESDAENAQPKRVYKQLNIYSYDRRFDYR
jgi:hypothetical protein